MTFAGSHDHTATIDAAPHVAALLLAAGGSRRLGAPKQLLVNEQGNALLLRLAAAAGEAGCTPIVIVLGAHADAVRELLHSAVSTDAVTIVENTDWASGMASSMRAGLDALEHSAATATVLVACDQPAVDAQHLRALIALHASSGSRVVSEYDGVAGIPAVWPRRDWPAMRAVRGDRGARALLHGDEPTVPLVGGALDLDTPADLARWRAAGTLEDPLD